MIELSTLEIDHLGNVLSVSAQKNSLLTELLPHEGNSVLDYWDENTNNRMKGYVESIFSRDGSIAFSLELNHNAIQFTAHHFAPNRAFLYCKPAKAKTLSEKKKEQQMRLVDFAFRNAVIAVLFLSEDGSIYDCSDETYRLLGYSHEEFSRLNITDLDPKVDEAYWKKAWIRHQTLVTDIVYTKLKRKDGCLIDVEVKTKHFEYEGLEVLGAFITDITEKKRIEEESYKEKKLLRTLIDHLPFSVFVKDNEGLKLIANKPDIEFMGLTTEAEALGKTDEEIFGGINKLHGYDEDMEVIGKGISVIDSDNVIIDKNGNKADWLVTKLPLKDDHNNIYGLVGICKNVTEEKKLEEKLKLVDFAFRNSAVPMHFITEDGTIYDCNNAACTLLGYTQEEYLTKTIFDFNKNNSKVLFKEYWNNFSYNSDKPTYLTLTNKDNKLIHVEARANKILYNNNELICSSFFDITQKIKIVNQLKLVDFAFRESSIPIFFIEEDGTLLNINTAALELYGYSDDEMRGMKVRIVSAIEDEKVYQQLFNEIWKTIKEKGRHFFVTKHKKKNGEILDIEINFNYLDFGGKKLNCAFLKDITETKRTEDRLKLVDFAFSNATTPIAYINKNGTFLNFNESYVELSGYTKEELLLHTISDLNEELTGKAWIALWNKVKEMGSFTFQSIRKRKDGTFLDIEVRANLINFNGLEIACVFITDITEKKKVEERLKLMESVIIQTNEAVVITEAEPIVPPGPRILFVNDAYTKMTGFTKEEAIGQTPRITQNANTQRSELDKVAVAFKNWSPFEMTIVNARKDGKEFWVNVRATPIANEKGWFTHWIAIQRDVTKEKEAEIEKEKLLGELIQNNLELKQFSYITTHNLRAPLTNLVSICNIIKLEKITDSVTLKLIEGFKRSTIQLNETLNDLINILIIKENIHLPKDKINFQDVLDKVKASLLITLIKEKVMLYADFDEVPFVSFSNIYLESILLNLITNSIQYRHPDRFPVIKIQTTMDADGNTILTFSDNGIGMDMERVKDKIFGLYQHFHNNANSKGIGLYLIHSQITALKGNIEVTREVNVGTTFTVTFR